MKRILKVVLYAESVNVQKRSSRVRKERKQYLLRGSLPRYRVIKTIKYNACDLNESPEQLYLTT